MSNRRFARLTNAFSTKIENHKHQMVIYAINYFFCRIHRTPRVAPAMESGIAKHVRSLEEIAGLWLTLLRRLLMLFAYGNSWTNY